MEDNKSLHLFAFFNFRSVALLMQETKLIFFPLQDMLPKIENFWLRRWRTKWSQSLCRGKKFEVRDLTLTALFFAWPIFKFSNARNKANEFAIEYFYSSRASEWALDQIMEPCFFGWNELQHLAVSMKNCALRHFLNVGIAERYFPTEMFPQ